MSFLSKLQWVYCYVHCIFFPLFFRWFPQIRFQSQSVMWSIWIRYGYSAGMVRATRDLKLQWSWEKLHRRCSITQYTHSPLQTDLIWYVVLNVSSALDFDNLWARRTLELRVVRKRMTLNFDHSAVVTLASCRRSFWNGPMLSLIHQNKRFGKNCNIWSSKAFLYSFATFPILLLSIVFFSRMNEVIFAMWSLRKPYFLSCWVRITGI